MTGPRARVLWIAGFAIVVAAIVTTQTMRGPKPVALPAPKASPSTRPTERVTVAVYDDGSPGVDHWVVAHDGAGAVLDSARTGADGRVAVAAVAGGMVTVVDPDNTQNMITIRDVVPGETLVVGEVEDEGGRADTSCTARLALPSPKEGAVRYVATLGVGLTEFPDAKKALPLPVLRRFLVAERFPVLALALDAGGQPIAFSHVRAGGCGDGGALDVKLPAWSSDFRVFTIAPTSAGDAKTIRAELAIASGEDRFPLGHREEPLATSSALRFSAPRPLGTDALLSLTVAYSDTDRAVLSSKNEQTPERIEIDLRTRLLPRISGARVLPAADPARPEVAWTVERSPTGADAAVVRIAWPPTREHVWTIIGAPEGPARVVLPALPDELRAFRPDGRPMTVAAGIVDASFLDGYGDVRRKGLAALEDPPEAGHVMVRSSVTGELEL